MIPTYNCAAYLRVTLQSVLIQDPGPGRMQIEVVDDHSTRDDPEAVVRDVGQGRVGFFRQPYNYGHVANFNTCLQRSRGHLVHLLHGDDEVRDGFYQRMQRPFEQYPELGAAFCRHIKINEHGVWHSLARPQQRESGIIHGAAPLIAAHQPFQPPGAVVRRQVYERLGGFDDRIRVAGEDWEMWVRIAAHYPIWYELEPMALYRHHSSSLIGRSIRSGESIQDIRRAIAIYSAYLPPAEAASCARSARELAAGWALGLAAHAFQSGETATGFVQIREALSCSRSLRTIRHARRVVMTAGFDWIRARARSPSV